MSAEEGAAQPPTAGSDKTQAPKPAATFSSFINKNTTGKKFAPKAARRRPGAAPAAAAPAPKPAAAEPTAPGAEAQTEQVEPVSSTATSEPTQLPTPAATQVSSTQNVAPALPTPIDDQPAIIAPAPVEKSTAAVTQRSPSPAVTNTEPQLAGGVVVADAPVAQPARDVEDGAAIGRAARSRPMDPPARESSAVKDALLEASVAEALTEPTTSILAETDPPAQLAQDEEQSPTVLQQELQASDTVEQVDDGEERTHATKPAATQLAADETTAPRPRKRRTLPWVAVNRPADGEEVEDETAPAPAKKRQPPKPRGKKKAAAATNTQDSEQQEGAVEGEAQQVRKRPTAKARGKRKADAANVEDGVEPPAPAKRTRRPRKAKDQDSANNPEQDVEEPTEEGREPVVRQKPRQPKRKKKTAVEGEADGEPVGAQPKRKGRPPREATPSDAEDHEIDPEATFMDSLASRNIRVGKLSDREKAMREIDWVAVRQRQREEDTRPIQTKQVREDAEELLNLTQPPTDLGARFTVVDGNIQMIHTSTFVDREADADREIENYEVVEERDLTTRITSRSFLKNNRRFPNDFLLPGQGKKWTVDDTKLFYQGLRNFGTDFQMISHMFPGSSRRSIKLKFTREERENPDIVRECLHGRSEIVSNWDTFMEASQMEETQFVDADEIKRSMDDYEAGMREKIAAATAEALERKRQQREAGLLDEEGEGNEASNKEKGKRKNRGKGKQVTFQEEAGVEIVGNIDDDHTWGQE